MAVLDETQKRFVVRRNAHRIRPKQIQAEFKAEFGIDITGVQICDLDPESAHGGERMGDDLTKYFWAERERYTKSEDAAPLNSRAVRQNMRLFEMETNPAIKRSPTLFLSFMEQASKDAGGMFVQSAPSGGTRGGTSGGEGDGTGTGEGDGDDNAEAAERSRRVDEIRQTLRDRRAGDTAAARVDEPPAGFGDTAAGTDSTLQR